MALAYREGTPSVAGEEGQILDWLDGAAVRDARKAFPFWAPHTAHEEEEKEDEDDDKEEEEEEEEDETRVIGDGGSDDGERMGCESVGEEEDGEAMTVAGEEAERLGILPHAAMGAVSTTVVLTIMDDDRPLVLCAPRPFSFRKEENKRPFGPCGRFGSDSAEGKVVEEPAVRGRRTVGCKDGSQNCFTGGESREGKVERDGAADETSLVASVMETEGRGGRGVAWVFGT